MLPMPNVPLNTLGNLTRHPRLALLTAIVLLAALAPGLQHLAIDVDVAQFVRGDGALKEAQATASRYRIEDFAYLVVVTPDDALADETLEFVRELEDAISRVPGVRAVVSLLDVPLVRNLDGPLTDLAANYRTLRRDDVNLSRARTELTESPLYRDTVVSGDGQLTGLQIFLEPPSRPSIAQRLTHAITLLAELRPLGANQDALTRINDIIAGQLGTMQLHLIGPAVLTEQLTQSIARDLVHTSLIAIVILTLVVAVVLRNLRGLVVMVCSIYGTVLTLCLCGFAGLGFNVMSVIVLPLALALGALMSLYSVLHYCVAGIPDSATSTHPGLGRPLLFAVAGAMAAFSALTLTNIPAAQQLGQMLALAAFSAGLTAYCLAPCLLVLLKPKSDQRAALRWTGLPRRQIRLALAACIVLGIAGGLRLTVQHSLYDQLRVGTVRDGLELVDQRMGGTLALDVLLALPSPTLAIPDDADSDLLAAIEEDNAPQDNWFTPMKIDRIKAVHDAMDGLASTGKIMSLASALRVAEQINGGIEFNAYELNIMYKHIPRAVRAAVIEPYLAIADDEARVALRLHDGVSAATLSQIENQLEDSLGLSAEDYRLTGFAHYYSKLVARLPQAFMLSTGAALVVLAALSLALRQQRYPITHLVLWNFLALLLTCGLAGWLGFTLDLMTVTFGAIALGLGFVTALLAASSASSPPQRIALPLVLASPLLFGGACAGLLYSDLIPLAHFAQLVVIVLALGSVLVLTSGPHERS